MSLTIEDSRSKHFARDKILHAQHRRRLIKQYFISWLEIHSEIYIYGCGTFGTLYGELKIKDNIIVHQSNEELSTWFYPATQYLK